VDFSNCHSLPPSQALALPFDPAATIRNGIRPALGGNVQRVTLLLHSPYGGDELCVQYVGLFGYCQGHKRAVVQCDYEANPSLKDHQVKGLHEAAHASSMR
jgi:hypothetical protein